LKGCACVVREAAGGGKFSAEQGANVELPGVENLGLFGLRLELDLSKDTVGEKAVKVFSPAVIGVGLLSAVEVQSVSALPQVSFRAAAVANMFWRPVKAAERESAVGYEWKIGPLCWLPK